MINTFKQNIKYKHGHKLVEIEPKINILHIGEVFERMFFEKVDSTDDRHCNESKSLHFWRPSGIVTGRV